jgi:hypothetical protein
MIWLLSSLIILETTALLSLAYYTYKMALVVLKVQDAVEESLDVLDKSYESISKILKIPLFYDSPEIKKTVENIRRAREAILYVAKQLTSIQEDEEEIGNKENNKAG